MSDAVLFILVLMSNVLITGSFYPLIYVAAAILHEAGHLLAMYCCGQNAPKIKFVGCGIRIAQRCVCSYKAEIIISAFGPLINIGFAIMSMLAYAIYPYFPAIQFAIANVVYAFLNLLPVSPLDGYKIISDILYTSLSYRSAKALLRLIGFAFFALFSVLLIFIILNKYLNVSLILVLTVVMLGAMIQSFKG